MAYTKKQAERIGVDKLHVTEQDRDLFRRERHECEGRVTESEIRREDQRMNTKRRQELAKFKDRLQALREDIDFFGEDLENCGTPNETLQLAKPENRGKSGRIDPTKSHPASCQRQNHNIGASMSFWCILSRRSEMFSYSRR